MNKALLADMLQMEGIELLEEQANQFETYSRELLEWNKKINLTALEDDDEIIVKHFYDSLLGIMTDCWTGKGYLLDIGTGAGFPGIPLKIMCPQVKVVLLDSQKKRIGFLEHIIATLQLNEIKAVQGRAEELGQDRGYRERYDYVVSRAVAKMPVLLEYCLPFLKIGGYFMAYKGPEGEAELDYAGKALEILGGSITEIKQYQLPVKQGKRKIIVIRKERMTAGQYPRRPGIPGKKPL